MNLLVHVTYNYLVRNIEKLIQKSVNLEIYFSAKNIDSLDIDTLKKLVLELGNGVILNLHAPFFDLNLGSVEPFVRKATLTRFKTLIPVIEAINPKNVVIHTGFDHFRYKNHVDEWIRNAVRTLSIIRGMIPGDITISVENVFDEDPYILENLLSHFDFNVGHCFDIGHFNVFSKTSLNEWLSRLGDRIIELHVHNNDGLEDRHWEVARGTAPVVELLSWAVSKKVPYITLEPHTEKEAERSIEYVKKFVCTEGL